MQNDGSVSPLRQFFRNKWVKLIIVIDIIAVVVVVAILVNNVTKTAIINFNVAPVDAKIQLNGQGDYNNGSYQVHPGNYKVTISHDGLESKTFDLDLQSDYNTTLTAFLKGTNDNFDFYTYKINYDSLQKLISIASEGNNLTTDQDPSAETFIANYQTMKDMLEKLPIEHQSINSAHPDDSTFFAINVGTDCERTICLLASPIINATHEDVLNFLRDQGYNPDDYEVKFQDKLGL